MVVKETIENIVQSKVGNKMNIEQINILDKLLLETRKSVNSNYLHFDKNGIPHSQPIDKEIQNKIRMHISQYAPQILYRYRFGSECDIKNLKEDNVWLSTLKEYNDPFENRIYIDFKAVADDLIHKDTELVEMMRLHHIDQNSPIYKQYLDFAISRGKKLLEELDMKRSRLFTACFSETKSSLLMWAHYANAHKGFCIGYEFKDLFNKFDINILPITYSDDFLRIDSFDTFHDHHEIFIKACKTKSKDWSYEKEWRLLGEYRINEPYQQGMIINIPRPICIYLGVNIDNTLKHQLIDICKEKEMKIYQMRISEKGYRLLAYQI